MKKDYLEGMGDSLDLLIVAGTSLVVSPANSLVYRASPTALRLVVNNEPVGAELGICYGEGATRDVYADVLDTVNGRDLQTF